MNKALIWLLTRTMIPRAVAMAIAGALLAWGIISDEPVERTLYNEQGEKVIVKESPKNVIGEAITVLIVGIGSMFIEQRKATEVKETQGLINSMIPSSIPPLKKDGLAGPVTRATIEAAAATEPPKGTIT